MLGTNERDLERQLLRQSVDLLAEDRRRCVDCGRSPLVGERVHRFGHGDVVCELCRVAHPGEPYATDLVKHFEEGLTVRRLTPARAA